MRQVRRVDNGAALSTDANGGQSLPELPTLRLTTMQPPKAPPSLPVLSLPSRHLPLYYFVIFYQLSVKPDDAGRVCFHCQSS
jgi:hypothetical protein